MDARAYLFGWMSGLAAALALLGACAGDSNGSGPTSSTSTGADSAESDSTSGSGSGGAAGTDNGNASTASAGGAAGSAGSGGMDGSAGIDGVAGVDGSATSTTGAGNDGDVLCRGFPEGCFAVCEASVCECHCEYDCSDPPTPRSDGCGECYADEHCSQGERCYEANCGAGGPTAGSCRRAPEAELACWTDRDCPAGAECSEAVLCPCGTSCEVPDAMGSCRVRR